MLPLGAFFQDQIIRLKRELASAQPVQTFTAGPKVKAYSLTPAHRREYVSSPRPHQPTDDGYSLHGTMQTYAQCGCRCGPCSSANSTYRRHLRNREEATHRTPAEHGTTKRYGRGCRCLRCSRANHEYGCAWRAAHPPNEAA